MSLVASISRKQIRKQTSFAAAAHAEGIGYSEDDYLDSYLITESTITSTFSCLPMRYSHLRWGAVQGCLARIFLRARSTRSL